MTISRNRKFLEMSRNRVKNHVFIAMLLQDFAYIQYFHLAFVLEREGEKEAEERKKDCCYNVSNKRN